MATIVVEISGDEKKFIDAMRKLEQAAAGGEGALGKLAKKADEVTESIKKQEKADADLERAAKRVYDEVRTPQERYAAKMLELNVLLEKGKLSQQDFGRAAKQAADSLEQTQKAGHGAFGAEAIGNVVSFGKAILGIGGPAAIVIGLLEKMREVRREAAQEARDAEASGASLAQLSFDTKTGKVDEKRFFELTEAAKKMQAEGGFKTREEANRLVFALASAGMEKEAGFYAKMHATGVFTGTEGLARGTKTIMASMGDQAGSARDVTNAVIAASGFAPTFAEQLAPAIARGGTGARATGIKLNELAAATAIVSEATGAPEQAGTNIRQLLRSLGKIGAGGVGEVSEEELVGGATEEANAAEIQKAMKGKTFDFKDKSLMQRLRMIEGAGLNEKELQKLFGRAQAMEAYRVILTNADRYEQAQGAVATAIKEDTVAKMLELPGKVPELAAAQAAREAEGQFKVAVEPLGTKTNLGDAVQKHVEARMAAGKIPQGFGFGDDPATAIAVNRMALGAESIIPGASDRKMRRALIAGELEDNPKLQQQVMESLQMTPREVALAAVSPWGGGGEDKYEFAKRMLEVADKLEQAAKALENANRPNPTLARPDQDR